MSNDISYVVKVVDEFSAPLRKFEEAMARANKAGNNLSTGTKNLSSGMKATSMAANNAAIGGISAFTEASTHAANSSKFFTQNLKDLGKAAGIYFGVQQVKNFAVGIYETRIQMDGLEASLSAILPKFDKSKSGTQLATDEINYLRDATNKLGVSFKDILPAYVQLISNSPFRLKETRDIFESFAGYGRLNALSGDQQKSMMFAIQQMMGKGKIQAQEWNLQLKPVMPGANDIFTKALRRLTKGTVDANKSLDQLMGEGRLGAGLLKEVQKVLQEDYGEAMIKKSHTLGGEIARNKNAFQEFQTILSTMFKPAMISTTLATNEFLVGLRDVFKAIDDQSVFAKQSEDLQALTTMLRIAKGLLQGLGEELSLIGKIGGSIWEGAKDIVKGVTIAGYAIAGGDKEIAIGAFQELGQQMKDRISDTNQIQLDINHNNTPRGTTTEVKSKTNPNLKVGNMVNYEGSYE